MGFGNNSANAGWRIRCLKHSLSNFFYFFFNFFFSSGTSHLIDRVTWLLERYNALHS